MRVVVALVTLVAVAGCDIVLGLDRKPDAAVAGDATDAPIVDAALLDAPCAAPVTKTLSALSDAFLAEDEPTTPTGGAGILHVSPVRRGVFRFQDPILSQQPLAKLVLVLQYAASANSCNMVSGACASCASYQVPGTIALYTMTSDWAEFAATYNKRNATDNWNQPGATGAGDRAMTPLATASYAVTAPVTFEIAGDELTLAHTWIDVASRISFMATTADAVQYVATREYNCPTGGAAAANLTIHYCP